MTIQTNALDIRYWVGLQDANQESMKSWVEQDAIAHASSMNHRGLNAKRFFSLSLKQSLHACQLIMPIHSPFPILLSRYLGSKLKSTLRQSTSRIPRINTIFILILPSLLNTPQRATVRCAPRPAITPNSTTTTIKPLIHLRQSSRAKTAANATI